MFSNVLNFNECSPLIWSSASSSKTQSTRACLLHCLKASASLLYVAAAPRLCFHVLSISVLWAGTELGAYPRIFCSSVRVSPRKGAISLQSAIHWDIWAKWASEHGRSHDDNVDVPWWWSWSDAIVDRLPSSREYHPRVRVWASTLIWRVMRSCLAKELDDRPLK